MKRPRAPLVTKLLRDLWRMRAQAVAIALVMAAGVGLVVMSFGMIRSLEATRAAYYDRAALAHVWAPLRRAPDRLLDDVRQIPGVATAESRITAAATLDVPGVAEPASARLHSLPGRINRLTLRAGRLPDPARPDEAVVSEAFAKAARIAPGDRLALLVHGKHMSVRIVGTALSPEYVYAVPPGEIFPDNRRFGVLWLAREPLAAALDMRDGFNEAVLRLAPGVNPAEAIRALDRLAAPYGAIGAYGRDLQISDRFVSSEIEQLRTTVEILPPVFLAVAAFLLNILLARLVDTEREVIGLLKAFGYRDGAVMRHYAALALLLSLGGLVIGCALGTWLGREMAGMYQEYFVFPFLDFVAGADIYLIAAGAALAAALAGAAAAVWRVQGLQPAEAMRPPAPATYRRTGLGEALARHAPDEPSRMIVRGLLRRPWRSAATVLGLASATGLYIASASAMDNIDRMIDLAFTRAQRASASVTFIEPRDAHVRRSLATLPGVARVEPFRIASATVRGNGRTMREAIMGVEAGADLVRTVDLDGRVIEPPPAGALLSTQLAAKLRVRPGDMLAVDVTDGDRPSFSLRVAGVVSTPLGAAITMERGALNRLLREGDVASGAHLAVDPARLDALFAALKRQPVIAGVTVHSATVRAIRSTIAENMGIVTLFNTGFAVLIIVGVTYTGARISLSERARDIASLRVLGFRRAEAGFVLLGEQAALGLMALPLGLLIGLALSKYIASSFSSDLYMIPFAVSTGTLAKGALVFVVAGTGAAWFIRRRADRLDLVTALKVRE